MRRAQWNHQKIPTVSQLRTVRFKQKSNVYDTETVSECREYVEV